MSAPTYLPTIADIRRLFEEETATIGGSSIAFYEDDQRLFARAVADVAAVVTPGDMVRGGVALYAAGPRVLVQPFVWRQVCTNGAIMTSTTGTLRAERIAVEPATISAAFVGAFESEVRQLIWSCADVAHLTKAVEAMRDAAALESGAMIAILPQLLRMPSPERETIVSMISARYEESGDDSAYAVVNAVTSVARDTPDPALRWRLEEVGGELLSLAHALASNAVRSTPALAPA